MHIRRGSVDVYSFFIVAHIVCAKICVWASFCYVVLIGLELAIDPPRGNFAHYDFLKLHYIRHKTKDVSPLRVAALTCNITLYTLPPPKKK